MLVLLHEKKTFIEEWECRQKTDAGTECLLFSFMINKTTNDGHLFWPNRQKIRKLMLNFSNEKIIQAEDLILYSFHSKLDKIWN